MDQTVGQALETLQSQLSRILGIGFSLYLYGSVPLGDFRPGWSDIDLLCVAPGELSEKQAEGLLNLRQIMQRRYPGNPHLRSFEGMIVPPDALSGRNALCVYWGTSGQRLVTTFSPDVFMRYELKAAASSSVVRNGSSGWPCRTTGSCGKGSGRIWSVSGNTLSEPPAICTPVAGCWILRAVFTPSAPAESSQKPRQGSGPSGNISARMKTR